MRCFMKLIGSFALLFGAVACSQPPQEPPATRSQPVARAEPAAVARPDTPKPQACDDQRLDAVLSAVHDPPTREDLVKVCPDPVPALIARATDKSARGLMRLRSIESLGKLGGPKAVKALTDLATAGGDLASMRRTAVEALARATPVGDVERERVGVGALSDSDPHVRVAAVKLLAGSPSPGVRTALEQAKAREGEVFVREEIERGLAQQ